LGVSNSPDVTDAVLNVQAVLLDDTLPGLETRGNLMLSPHPRNTMDLFPCA
jgi:hypothetical protein